MRIDITFAYESNKYPIAQVKISDMGLAGFKRVKNVLNGVEIMLKECQPTPKKKEEQTK